MFRELIKPFFECRTVILPWKGLYIQVHDCGRCEDFIDDWLELGITAWDPLQTMKT